MKPPYTNKTIKQQKESLIRHLRRMGYKPFKNPEVPYALGFKRHKGKNPVLYMADNSAILFLRKE